MHLKFFDGKLLFLKHLVEYMFIFVLSSSLFSTQCSAEVLVNGFYLVGKHLLQLWVRSCGKSF